MLPTFLNPHFRVNIGIPPVDDLCGIILPVKKSRLQVPYYLQFFFRDNKLQLSNEKIFTKTKKPIELGNSISKRC